MFLVKLKAFAQTVWSKFRSLKRWQQILALILIIGIFGSSGSTQDNSDKSAAIAKPEVTPSAEPTSSENPQKTPENSLSPSPETPLEFRFSALRDLTDMRKDIQDARTGITENGLGKFYWNVIEIEFNMSQLENLTPRLEYQNKWDSALRKLKSAVEALGSDKENLTISKAISKLNDVLSQIPALEKIARALAN